MRREVWYHSPGDYMPYRFLQDPTAMCVCMCVQQCQTVPLPSSTSTGVATPRSASSLSWNVADSKGEAAVAGVADGQGLGFRP